MTNKSYDTKPKPQHRTTEFEARLPKDANPLAWVSLKTHQVDQMRWMRCPNYNECLTYAASKGWFSFVCIFCPVWEDRETNIPFSGG